MNLSLGVIFHDAFHVPGKCVKAKMPEKINRNSLDLSRASATPRRKQDRVSAIFLILFARRHPRVKVGALTTFLVRFLDIREIAG
jgi:hypothetical protein